MTTGQEDGVATSFHHPTNKISFYTPGPRKASSLLLLPLHRQALGWGDGGREGVVMEHTWNSMLVQHNWGRSEPDASCSISEGEGKPLFLIDLCFPHQGFIFS